MKSKISFFKPGIAKSLLRRFWPLWGAYFAVIVYLLPVRLYNQISYTRDWQLSAGDFLDNFLLQCGVLMMWVSAVACILAVMAVFSFLYNTRGCSMIASLPVRRETVFLTCCLTGLLPLLLADVLALLLAVPVAMGHVELRCLLMCFGMMAMSNLFFFSFGAFCAMLTGNIVVLPAVYAVLNFAVGVAEGSLRYLLSYFVYGMNYFQDHALDWLSPALFLWEKKWVVQNNAGLTTVGSFYALIAYSAAGLLLLGAALLLFRKRRMETATEAVAIRALKPVFKYCMTFGTAMVFAVLVCESLLRGKLRGPAAAAAVLGLMLAGAFLGYFAAEMLMKKTVKVFRGNWRGCLAGFGVIAAFVLCFELDLTGFERRLPKAEELMMVECMGASYTEPEDIEAFLDFHRQVIAHKAENEAAEETVTLYMTYVFKEGGRPSLVRRYEVARDEEAEKDPDSDLMRLQAMLNSPAGILGRMPAGGAPVEESSVYYARLYSKSGGGTCELTPEQAADFYNNCFLPEAKEGNAGQRWIVFNDGYYDSETDVVFELQLAEWKLNEQGQTEPRVTYNSFFELSRDAERCLQWVRENTDLDPRPIERPEA